MKWQLPFRNMEGVFPSILGGVRKPCLNQSCPAQPEATSGQGRGDTLSWLRRSILWLAAGWGFLHNLCTCACGTGSTISWRSDQRGLPKTRSKLGARVVGGGAARGYTAGQRQEQFQVGPFGPAKASHPFPGRIHHVPGGFRRCFTPCPPSGLGLRGSGGISQRGGGSTGWGKGRKGRRGEGDPGHRILAPVQEPNAAGTRCIDAAPERPAPTPKIAPGALASFQEKRSA